MTFFSNVTTYAPLAAASRTPAIVFSRLSARSAEQLNWTKPIFTVLFATIDSFLMN